MLRFNKGFNSENNDIESKYSKFGRVAPEEIISKRFNRNMENIKSVKQEPKKIEVNNKLNNLNKLNGFRKIDRMK